MSTELECVNRRQTSALRRSDARGDLVVTEHMAKGEVVQFAQKYTQTPSACLAQIGIFGLPAGLLGGLVAGPVAAALLVAGFGALLVGLEMTNRVVITDEALVLQTSAVLRRYQRDLISDLRVESLSVRHWARLDVNLLDPSYLFRKAPGLRFSYQEGTRKRVEVFVGTEDADALLAELTN